jgi:hypothetical protein
MPGSHALQPCLAAMPGSHARQPCPAAMPGSHARQPCPAAMPGSHARQPCAMPGRQYVSSIPDQFFPIFLLLIFFFKKSYLSLIYIYYVYVNYAAQFDYPPKVFSWTRPDRKFDNYEIF